MALGLAGSTRIASIAAGSHRGHLFVRGTNVAVVPEDKMVEALVEWAEFIHEHGIERALAKADLKAAKEAAASYTEQFGSMQDAAGKLVHDIAGFLGSAKGWLDEQLRRTRGTDEGPQ